MVTFLSNTKNKMSNNLHVDGLKDVENYLLIFCDFRNFDEVNLANERDEIGSFRLVLNERDK